MKEHDRGRGQVFFFFSFSSPVLFRLFFWRGQRALFNLMKQSSADCNKERGRWNGESGIKAGGEERRWLRRERKGEGKGAGFGGSGCALE